MRGDHSNLIDGVWTTEEGVEFLPGNFNIVGFVDCVSFQTSRPGTGPDGDFRGAPCREGWYIKQRAFYSRYNKMHGIKLLAYSLPNGLTGATYGPVSHRQNDNCVAQWSCMDQVL